MREKEQVVHIKKGRIGLISDTHGLIRSQALEALRGVELILHAGDIGKPEVLASLEALAPVMAIRGNVDRGDWARPIPDSLTVRINELKFQLIHDVHNLMPCLPAAGYHGVVSGHSHKPSVVRRDGILWINPGSAGPRRFHLPVTVGLLFLNGKKMRAQIIEIV